MGLPGARATAADDHGADSQEAPSVRILENRPVGAVWGPKCGSATLKTTRRIFSARRVRIVPPAAWPRGRAIAFGLRKSVRGRRRVHDHEGSVQGSLKSSRENRLVPPHT